MSVFVPNGSGEEVLEFVCDILVRNPLVEISFTVDHAAWEYDFWMSVETVFEWVTGPPVATPLYRITVSRQEIIDGFDSAVEFCMVVVQDLANLARLPLYLEEIVIITSKFDARCFVCNKFMPAGTKIGWVPGQKKSWCEGCLPDEHKNPFGSGVKPGDVPRTADGKPDLKRIKLPRTPTPAHTATLKALAFLEDALLEKTGEPKYEITEEIEKEWSRYNKFKALALDPSTTREESRSAMKMALVNIVKLVF